MFGRGRNATKHMADLLMPKVDLSVLSEGDADEVNQKANEEGRPA
jgi:hypothetical protein